MALTADISKDASGQFTVTALRDIRCPACQRNMVRVSGHPDIEITCTRCKGKWKYVRGEITMLRSPKHVSGPDMLDIVEKYCRKNLKK